MKILVVDDHEGTRQLLQRSFDRAGHNVKAVASLETARTATAAETFDVVVLDVMLPDGSGVELCKEIRDRGLDTPILLLTARGEVGDRVAGLDAGADDYMAKPFAVSELQARVRALGRRGPALREATVTAGPVTVDLNGRRVFLNDEPVTMTARELAILEVLAKHRGGVVARDDLLESVWGEVTDSAHASLEVLIARIRRKLGGADAPIQTVRGLGYALQADKA